MARPLYEYVVTQNAEACLIFCTSEMVPNRDTRDLIEEVLLFKKDCFIRMLSREMLVKNHLNLMVLTNLEVFE